MKKYIALLIITALCVCTAFVVPNTAESFLPQVKTVMASVDLYSESVTGTGSIRYREQTEVTSSMPLVIGVFKTEIGDKVKSGDIIATVDKQASSSLVSGLAQLSGLVSASTDMSTVLSLIPDVIYANGDGTIISIAGNGATVESSCSIATIANPDKLIMHAAVSENDISDVFVGQTAIVSGAGFNGTVYRGEVSEIYPTARKRYTGTVLETVVDVIISLDNSDGELRSGYTATASIQLDEPHNICILPYSAICQDDNGEYVYVCVNGEAVRRDIKTGAELPDGAEVVSGISPADRVILSPEGISSNSLVKVINN